MNLFRYKKEVVLVFLSTIITLSVWLYLVNIYDNNLKVNEHALLENEFDNSVSSLKLALSETSSFIYGLRGYVYSQIESGIDETSFNTYANNAQTSTNSIKNFSIAPDNIQTFVYPLEGNEATVGHNLNEDDRVSLQIDLKRIRETEATVISGPYKLRQGGFGIIIRDPIIFDGKYWGLANIVVDFDDLIMRSNITNKNSNLIFSIADNKGIRFFGEDIDRDPEFSAKISFINENWTIYACSKVNTEYLDLYINRLNTFKIISFIVLFFAVSLITTNIYRNIMLSSKVQDMIYKDLLTNLPNRRALREKMNESIRLDKKFAVTFLDLDNFKNINDVLGHSVGDDVLIKISERLRKFESKDMNVFRWGGDEFLIISENYENEEDIILVFMNLIKDIKEPVRLFDKEYRISASIGISFYPNDGEEVEELLKNSDIAMYHAKKSGKDTISLYNKDIGKNTAEKIELERKLSHSLDYDQLKVFYQPKVNMQTNKIVGAEALVRWFVDDTIIAPNKFIPIAEANGYIVKIDQFVLRETIKFISKWNDEGIRLYVSCNISAEQFNEETFSIIKDSFKVYNIHREQLEIEITETTTIENFEYARDLIDRLKKIGVGVALDDFGTGYSSLSYLSMLNISTLKIDRSFVKKLEENSHENKIVKAIIALAGDIDLNIIAEGVENEEQRRILKDLGCYTCQGYYYSRAISPEDFYTYYKKYSGEDS